MKKMFLVLGFLLSTFFIYVALQPADYTIQRDILIQAPAEKIFPYLNNSKMAEQWGPWREIDPSAKMVYSGPDDGVGSKSSWQSEGHLGTGSATIVNSVANEKVVVQLEYSQPMVMSQLAEYRMASVEGQTQVTWSVSGKNTFVGRLMCTFMNMDQRVGSMFEKGLQNLKSLIEKS